MAEQVKLLELDQQVQTVIVWIRVCTKSPAKTVDTLTTVNLTDSTLHSRQDLLKKLPPPLPTTTTQPLIHYLLIPPVLLSLLATGPEKRWENGLRRLLCLCNITAVDDLLPIWWTAELISWDRSIEAMELTCRTAADCIHYQEPYISYTIVVMVLDLAFYTK